MEYTKKRRGITIREVAARAGVSPMSVSNFINGRTNLMRVETRSRIEQAIAATGYQPNKQARAFRQGKDYSVGMIVVDPSPNFLLEPFIGHVVTGLSMELALEGYACLLQRMEDYDDERALANFARSDALCIFASGPTHKRDRFFEKLSSIGIPLALIEEDQRHPESDTALIRQDDVLGGTLLMEHLLALGARNFLYVRHATTWSLNSAREAGFRAGLKEAGGWLRFETLTCGFGNFDEVRQRLNEWLDAGGSCDAILANNDHVGVAVLNTLSERNIRVPQDIKVTGFGGFELWKHIGPQLTTIVSPAQQLGRCAARVLLNRLAEGSFRQPEWVLPVSLKIGETTVPAIVSPKGDRPENNIPSMSET